VPALTATASDLTPAGMLIVNEVRMMPSPPTGGTFRLSAPGVCESVLVNVSDNASTLRAKLASLPGLGLPLRVDSVQGTPNALFNSTWRIVFDPSRDKGDLPPLRVASVSGLSGLYPAVSVVAEVNGGTDVFWAPIPGDMMALPVASPGSLSLDVNGVSAACLHPSGLCSFTYDAAATPAVTAISPTRLGLNGTDADATLTISGSSFLPGTAIRLEPAGGSSAGASIACNVTQAIGTTQLACRLVASSGQTLAAGQYQLVVDVPGQGYAANAPTVTLDTLKALSVSPSAVAAVGWTRVTLAGLGFDPLRCGSYAVLVGSATAAVLECGATYMQVLLPGLGGASVAAVRVQLLSANGTVVTQHVPANLYVTVGTAAAPSILSIDSAVSLPSGSSIDVAATLSANWTALQPAAMYLLPAFLNATTLNTSSRLPASAAAYTARVACLLSRPAVVGGAVGQQHQQVVCSTGGAVPLGSYHIAMELTATTPTSGTMAAPWLLLSNATVRFDMVVTSVSPAFGSAGGGTLLSVTGSGFPTTNTTVAVFIRVPRSATFPDGLLPCDVVSVSATLLTCRTRPHAAAAGDFDDPLGRNLQATPTTAAAVMVLACGLLGGGGGSSLGGGMCTAAASRAVEARCGAANAAACTFR
jgi:hypothetical protein